MIQPNIGRWTCGICKWFATKLTASRVLTSDANEVTALIQEERNHQHQFHYGQWTHSSGEITEDSK